ncbi:MAG: hypothetical protein QGI78_07750 [Phycisphaerales bacterium]|nr:hypothetical protein [Phycisphaerales bacterium]
MTEGISSGKMLYPAMVHQKILFLFLAFPLTIVSCEQKEPSLPPQSEDVVQDDQDPVQQGASFLDQQREKTDYEAKFKPKQEVDPAWIHFSDFRTPRPQTWEWLPPLSTMRLANYTIQGTTPNEDAEVTILQFAEGEGADLEVHVERWKSSFRSTGGGPVRPIIATRTIAGFPSTIVEITGEYMGIGASWHRANYTMLIAFITYDKGNIMIRLLGPNETIELERRTWEQVLDGVLHEESLPKDTPENQ